MKGFEHDSFCGVCDSVDELVGIIAGSEFVFLERVDRVIFLTKFV